MGALPIFVESVRHSLRRAGKFSPLVLVGLVLVVGQSVAQPSATGANTAHHTNAAHNTKIANNNAASQTALAPASTLPVLNLQARINRAIRDGDALLKLPAGAFQVNEPVVIERAKNLTIDGTGTRLVWTIAKAADAPDAVAIYAENNQGLTLRGFTMDFDPLPWTQGKIVAINRKDMTVDLEIDRGYRNDAAFLKADNKADGLHLHAFRPEDRVLAWNDTFVTALDVRRVRGRIMRFELHPEAQIPAYRVGTLLATGAWRISAMAVVGTSGLVVDDVTVWASGGAALLETSSLGGSDIKMNVVPGPPPAGATAPRLWSSTRDAYHGGNIRQGPVIHDSEFEAAGDDMVSVFSGAMEVSSVSANGSVIQIKGRAPSMLRVGDELRVLSRPSYRESSIRKVERIQNVSGGSRITLSGGTNAKAGDQVTSPNLAGEGTVVRDTTFTNGVSTAVTLKSRNAQVVGNTIQHFGQAGIVLGPDFGSLESDAAESVTVENNQISDVGRSLIYRDSSFGHGAGIVVGVQTTPGKPAKLLGNRSIKDITIRGNRVEDAPGWGLLISNTVGALVENNLFVRPNDRKLDGEGSFWGLVPKEVVLVRDSANVVLRGNQVTAPGRNVTRLAHIDPTADAGTVDISGIAITGQ